MRHRKHKKTLGRTSTKRTALLRDLATSFFLYGKIRTTAAKAKFVKPVVERILHRAKSGSREDRRYCRAILRTDDSVKRLFEQVAPKQKDRRGGYTRIVKVGSRSGDGASMVILSLID